MVNVNAARNAALAFWSNSEIAFRLASDEMLGASDAELNSALAALLASRVGLRGALELVEAEAAALYAERQAWALEQLCIADALARGESAEQGRARAREILAA